MTEEAKSRRAEDTAWHYCHQCDKPLSWARVLYSGAGGNKNYVCEQCGVQDE